MPDQPRVLIVDDKLSMAETLADGLGDHGFAAVALGSAREALERLAGEPFDALVTDLRMPELDGLSVLEQAHQRVPELPVIVMTAYGAIDTAVESIRRGAFHYLTKPFKIDELVVFLKRAISDRDMRRETTELRRETRELRQTIQSRYSTAGIIGRSAAMQRVFGVIERIAATKATVLITGETGTGKGAVARALHGSSVRADGPFVAINCAALPDQLLESQLFGHLKGSFTGATSDRAGLFADANRGTLLLDEIGEMSPALQAKLLHVLESGSVRPLGATREVAVDVRVLAATHRDLRQRIREGLFREDLLYRLEVVSVELPPLRQRREDLPLLVEHFLSESNARHGLRCTGFSKEALALILDHGWPGNIRELAHVVERGVLLSTNSAIGVDDLPVHLRHAPITEPVPSTGDVLPIREIQRRYARWALERMNGHKGRTASELGVDVKTLNRWLDGDDDRTT